MAEYEEAVERGIAGLEKKNRLINPREREIVAYHEMGHAVVAASLPGTDPGFSITKKCLPNSNYRKRKITG